MSVNDRYSPKISACGASMATRHLRTLPSCMRLVSKGDNDLQLALRMLLLESYHPLA